MAHDADVLAAKIQHERDYAQREGFLRSTHWLSYEDATLLIAALRAPQGDGAEMMQWQPIKTAPKGRNAEGKMQYVLLIGLYPHGTGHWSDIRQGWWDEFGERWERWVHPFPPTHWMLSPAPPAQGTEAEGRNTAGGSVHEGPVGFADAPSPHPTLTKAGGPTDA